MDPTKETELQQQTATVPAALTDGAATSDT
jgi:hypothetical protein